MDVRQWFDHKTPRPRVSSGWVSRALRKRQIHNEVKAERRCVWIGGLPVIESKGRRAKLHISGPEKEMAVVLPPAQAIWLKDVLIQGGVRTQPGGNYPSWRDVRQTFPGTAAEFTSFIKQPAWRKIRAAGLLLV